MKEIVNKILKSWSIVHRDLWASKQEIEQIREYLPTVWYKLLTTYTFSITTKYSVTKFREKSKWKWRIYSIIKL